MKIPGKYIKALLLFSAKKDPINYMNGVCFEITGGTCTLIASTWHVLCAIRCDAIEDDDGSYIISNDTLKNVTSESDVTVTFNESTVSVEQSGMTTTGKLIDGLYPTWQRIVPDRTSGVIGTFSAEDLLAAHKARELINPIKYKYIEIAHNGDNAAVVNIGDPNVLILIAPVRINSTTYSKPDWV